MFENLVKSFDCERVTESISPIQDFISCHLQSTSIPELSHGDLRERLWSGLFTLLKSPAVAEGDKLVCVTALKILIRDKTDLNNLVTKERIKVFLKCAHLLDESDEFPDSSNKERIVESVKCLYNIILNFKPAVEMLNECCVMRPLIKRVVHYNDPSDAEVKLFDLKLVFLMTAFCVPSRIKLLTNENCLPYFNSVLASQLNNQKSSMLSKELKLHQQKILSDELKILFNILLEVKSGDLETVSKAAELKSLVAVLREYLNADIQDLGMNLKSDVINLLTLIPIEYLGSLTSEGAVNSRQSSDSIVESGLLGITKILDYLDKVLTESEDGKNSNPNARAQELLPPVLLVLLKLAQSGSLIRKHIRKRILPKLTEAEVYTRPEEGQTLRNKLCRLLTSPISNITDVTADLLFILCKESVGRMVKYTGYGNAAGLFARRGLISHPLEYSSDSEGSESEEYDKHREFINPIVGCRTPAQPDPLDGMTDEQKEVLALELVNKVDRLMRHNIIQPCIIGQDGKLEPIEHVDQLKNSILPPKNDSNCSNDD